MSDYRWTVCNGGNDRIHLELPLTPHIDDVMNGVLEDARFGEVDSIVIKYANGLVHSYNCYRKVD